MVDGKDDVCGVKEGVVSGDAAFATGTEIDSEEDMLSTAKEKGKSVKEEENSDWDESML